MRHIVMESRALSGESRQLLPATGSQVLCQTRRHGASTVLESEDNSQCQPLLERHPVASRRSQPPVLLRLTQRGLVEALEAARVGYLRVAHMPVGADEDIEEESAFLRKMAGGHGVGRLSQGMVWIDSRRVDDGLGVR
jgi:hypothetical protein